MTRRRKSPLPEANKMARSIRSGSTTGDLAVKYGINSHVIIQQLRESGWNPDSGEKMEPKKTPTIPLATLGGGPGETRHHVGGGDNPTVVPTVARPFTQRPHPTGLVWPEPAPVEAPAYRPRHRKPGPARERIYDPNASGRGIPGGKLTADQRAEIAKRYLEGEPSTALAVEYGVNDRTVRKLLIRMEVPVRTRGEAMRLRHDQRRARQAIEGAQAAGVS